MALIKAGDRVLVHFKRCELTDEDNAIHEKIWREERIRTVKLMIEKDPRYIEAFFCAMEELSKNKSVDLSSCEAEGKDSPKP